MIGTPFDVEVARCDPSPWGRPVKIGAVLQLAQSIKDGGLIQPIRVRRKGERFEIIVGGHRVAAYRDLGLEFIPALVVECSDLQAELSLIDENLVRNELSPIERDIAIARRKVIYEQLHPETKVGATGKGRAKVRQNGEAKKPAERFTKATAEATGQGERTIQRSVSRVETIGAETLGTLVDTSLNAPAEIDALAALSPERREKIIERAVAGEKVSAKVAAKQERRDQREVDLAEKQRALPQKKYGLIYVDVPRHFHVRSDETGMDRSPENHYPTMTFEELCDLPVQDIAADDCILIYWSTAASLIDDLEIMAEWGFVTFRPREAGRLRRDEWHGDRWHLPNEIPQNYRSMQVWDKLKIGMGYWFRDRHEFILVGARGNVVAPAQGTQDHSIVAAEKGEHSAKPVHVADMIDRLWPNIPKIELFARIAREGWDIWGKEAPTEIHERPSTSSESSPAVAPQSEAAHAGTGGGMSAGCEGRMEDGSANAPVAIPESEAASCPATSASPEPASEPDPEQAPDAGSPLQENETTSSPETVASSEPAPVNAPSPAGAGSPSQDDLEIPPFLRRIA